MLTLGAQLLKYLEHPKTVSELWEDLPRVGEKNSFTTTIISYDVFVLTLDFLYIIGAAELEKGLLTRKKL